MTDISIYIKEGCILGKNEMYKNQWKVVRAYHEKERREENIQIFVFCRKL